MQYPPCLSSLSLSSHEQLKQHLRLPISLHPFHRINRMMPHRITLRHYRLGIPVSLPKTHPAHPPPSTHLPTTNNTPTQTNVLRPHTTLQTGATIPEATIMHLLAGRTYPRLSRCHIRHPSTVYGEVKDTSECLVEYGWEDASIYRKATAGGKG